MWKVKQLIKQHPVRSGNIGKGAASLATTTTAAAAAINNYSHVRDNCIAAGLKKLQP